MTADEAVYEMKQGRELTHRYFSPEEWVTMKDGRVYMEDGASIDFRTFWADRPGESWLIDWEIFQPLSHS